MKIIDIYNKIANGEEVPKKIKYQNYIYEYQHRRDTESCFNYMCNENGEYLSRRYFIDNILNDEVEILEEEKKIPEKLNMTYMKKIDDDAFITERFSQAEQKIVDTVNALIDYLKSKGE